MIKLVVFDLDGVLVSSKEAHFKALNAALKEIDDKYVISKDEHLKFFDGLPTRKKLKLLSEQRGLPPETHESVWKRKQKLTTEIISEETRPNYKLQELFRKLKEHEIQIYVASNAIKQTVKLYLLRLGLMEFVDDYISNEDVKFPKPNPEMYLKCMAKTGSAVSETIIVEDSHVGIEAALSSGAILCRVKDPDDVSENKLFSIINEKQKISYSVSSWVAEDLNILIPMAGAGSRFVKAGFTFPKPLIDVNNKPMIQLVVESLNIKANYIYIVQKKHYEQYNLKYLLNLITPNCKIIQIDTITEGAACTTLLAKEYIDNDNSLLIANSDQYIEWKSKDFMYYMSAGKTDGGILTFESTHPKWSYVKTDEEGFITEVAEKKVISNIATVGIYYWSKGSEYVKYAEQMIEKNVRVNNEFYVAPVYNEAVLDGKKIKYYNIDKMYGLGTPEDLNRYLNET